MAKPPSKSSDDKSDKEARLAAALRANLRRRKAAARNPAKGASAPKDRDEPAGD
ncbi:MAG: hypothetical protein K0R83_895 [Caulobacter sp.]|jgi:hypothetical protein|nr:hypothetical protein [Caulobacter sp.]